MNEPEQSFIQGSLSRRWNYFGYDVAMSADGSRLAVAAPYIIWGSSTDDFDGRVYVFSRRDGVWHEEALLRAWGLEWPAQTFGRSIALSADGNTLAVGANESRAFYVFVRKDDVWSQSFFAQKEAGNFGGAVVLSADGTWLAVGARDAGLAVVYKRSGGSWTEHAELKPKDPKLDSFDANYFGRSIALSADGNTLIAGSPDKGDSGAVYIFERKDNICSEQGFLESPNAKYGDDFGESVSVSSDGRSEFGEAVALCGDGSALAVGSSDIGRNEGGVYVFTPIVSKK